MYKSIIENIESIDNPQYIEELVNKRYVNLKYVCRLVCRKIKVACKKCAHEWPTSIKNAFVFHISMLQLS